MNLNNLNIRSVLVRASLLFGQLSGFWSSIASKIDSHKVATDWSSLLELHSHGLSNSRLLNLIIDGNSLKLQTSFLGGLTSKFVVPHHRLHY